MDLNILNFQKEMAQMVITLAGNKMVAQKIKDGLLLMIDAYLTKILSSLFITINFYFLNVFNFTPLLLYLFLKNLGVLVLS